MKRANLDKRLKRKNSLGPKKPSKVEAKLFSLFNPKDEGNSLDNLSVSFNRRKKQKTKSAE